MELNLSASNCQCRTLFCGPDRNITLRHQLLELGKYIDAHTFRKIKRHKFTFRTSSSQFILSDGDQEAVTELLDNGAYVDGMNISVKLNRKMEALKRFFKKKERNIDAHMFRESALNLALRLNMDVDIIKELLIHGANACIGDSRGVTPLHQAVSCARNVEIIKLLLKCGADADSAGSGGFTPLQMAVMHGGNAEVIEELLKYGAHVDRAGLSFYGSPPLTIAILLDRGLRVIQTLLAGGANVNIPNERGDTPLILAASRCDELEIITELFEHKTDILDSKNCSYLLNIAIENNVLFAMILIKQSLITFEGDYHRLFNLSPYKKSPNYATLLHYLEDCIREIMQMKTLKIKNGLSLFTLVTTKNTSIGLYPNIEWIEIQQNIFMNYPIYKDVIMPKIGGGFNRGTLYDKVKGILIYSNCCSTESVEEIKVLSHDCTYIIATYLSNMDIRNLVTVFCNSYEKLNHV